MAFGFFENEKQKLVRQYFKERKQFIKTYHPVEETILYKALDNSPEDPELMIPVMRYIKFNKNSYTSGQMVKHIGTLKIRMFHQPFIDLLNLLIIIDEMDPQFLEKFIYIDTIKRLSPIYREIESLGEKLNEAIRKLENN